MSFFFLSCFFFILFIVFFFFFLLNTAIIVFNSIDIEITVSQRGERTVTSMPSSARMRAA